MRLSKIEELHYWGWWGWEPEEQNDETTEEGKLVEKANALGQPDALAPSPKASGIAAITTHSSTNPSHEGQ